MSSDDISHVSLGKTMKTPTFIRWRRKSAVRIRMFVGESVFKCISPNILCLTRWIYMFLLLKTPTDLPQKTIKKGHRTAQAAPRDHKPWKRQRIATDEKFYPMFLGHFKMDILGDFSTVFFGIQPMVSTCFNMFQHLSFALTNSIEDRK